MGDFLTCEKIDFWEPCGVASQQEQRYRSRRGAEPMDALEAPPRAAERQQTKGTVTLGEDGVAGCCRGLIRSRGGESDPSYHHLTAQRHEHAPGQETSQPAPQHSLRPLLRFISEAVQLELGLFFLWSARNEMTV